jgi:hypothetical protein
MSDGDDIYQTWAKDADRERARRRERPAPSFAPDIAARMAQGKRQGSYETGNPQYDNFLRTGMGGQPPRSDDPRHYRDPQAFNELMQDMYEAGTYDDPQARMMINNKYRGSPLQPLLLKAFEEGRKAKQSRRSVPPREVGL